MPVPAIRRALISVYDKTGIVEFARALHNEFGVEIISTGGTAKALTDAGIPVTLVETLTGCGEMLDGRVKTLHPAIHAAILADRDNPEHMRQLAAAGIQPIDMVVVNLYPFEKTVADPNCTFEQAIEMIDIGGVALLRAAAKNHKHVVVLGTHAEQSAFLNYLRERAGGWNEASIPKWRTERAWQALWQTSRYDAAISAWLARWPGIEPYTMRLRALHLSEAGSALRYGENPHQSADAFDVNDATTPLSRHPPMGENPPMSYNNYLDADAALGLCAELARAYGAHRRGCAEWNSALLARDADSRSAENKPSGAPPPGGPAEFHSAAERGTAEFDSAAQGGTPEFHSAAERGTPEFHSAAERGTAEFHSAAERGPAAVHSAAQPAAQPEHRQPPTHRFPVADEQTYRRKLPHWQRAGATYFVTFSSAVGRLSPEERDVVLASLRHWDATRLDLHIAAVMPDHVHALLTPRRHGSQSDSRHNLTALLQSIKAYSAREVNRLRGTRGSVWLSESYDRWMRTPAEFHEKWRYIADNPVKEGLAATPDKYAWFYANDQLDPFTEHDEVRPRRTDAPAHSDEVELRRTDAPAHSDEVELRRTDVPAHSDGMELRRTAAHDSHLSTCVFIKHSNACGVGVVKAPSDPAAPESREPAALHAVRVEAYRRAYLGDPNAAMGGVLAVNFVVDADFAAVVMQTYDRFGRSLKATGAANAPGGFFVEVWIAPAFTDDAVAIIRGTYDPATATPGMIGGLPAPKGLAYGQTSQTEKSAAGPNVTDMPAAGAAAGAAEGAEVRNASTGSEPTADPIDASTVFESVIAYPPQKQWGKNVRLLAVGDMTAPPEASEMQYRSIVGGMLVQSPDVLGLNEHDWTIVTQRSPSESEMADLRLAWLVCKHTKSNAITLVKDGMLIGNGAGQMSRVMSCRIATWLARENGHSTPADLARGAAPHGIVAASDAFFPFPDGPHLLIDAGVTAIIQPGGSKRDQETINLCNERGVAMIFTHTRHFRH